MIRLVVAVVVLLLTAGCGLPVRSGLRARLLHPPTMTCPDGRPVRILVGADCDEGICGYTCAPGRWRDPCLPNSATASGTTKPARSPC
jgi:hypothetical protein